MHPAKRFRSENYTVHDVVEMELEDQEPVPEPEPRTFSEVISISYENIDQELCQTITDLTDFETLEVIDIPTLNDAVNLISSDLLRQKFYQTSYSIVIRLKIIDKITTLSPLQYEIISTKIDKTRKFLLCLESSEDKKCCFYWKLAEEMPLMALSLIDLEIVNRESMNSFVNWFLLLALRFGNDGLSPEAKLTSSTDLSLFSLVDVNDKNLLMLASELGNRPVVEDLIKIGFDVNFQVDNQIAADLAWQNRHLDVLLSLLLENSLYPMDFNEANTSNEMKEFVKMTHQFVKSVKNNDETTVQNILDKYPNLRYFYSRDNVSAAFVALSKEKFNIYRIFMNKNVCVGPKEDIDKILTKFNDKKREELRKIHLEHSREPPEKFLMILHSNTSVGHDTINVNEKLNHAKSAIEYLCRISIIRLILQVVAASRDFKLIFDFNRDSVQFLDPTSSKHTRGSFFTSRQIYIAAKFFLDPLLRQEAIGTLAHELCHYAMYLVYKNNCLPYFNGDHKMAKTFHGYLKYCHENRKKEKIIGYVFDIPKENQETRHAELIVRVPHLMALYHEDQDRLDQLRELFSPLFSFFEFKVVEDMKTALPNIETEADGDIKKFNDKRKRKGFCRTRNLLILILICSLSVIGIVLGIYFGFFGGPDNPLVGEVRKPWNAIIRHSRTDEVMCIGSLIHVEFVLTTAECVQKKNHRIPLPPALFTVEFHPVINEFVIRINVSEVNVHYQWQPNETNLKSDISLLKFEQPLTFNEYFYPINLPTQLIQTSQSYMSNIKSHNCINNEVLHTIQSLHSFNIPISRIELIECILKDYTVNSFLGDLQYCARQLENKFCINGYGEQLYDSKQNTLNGLVSMGHQTEADCVNDNSLIITELGYYSDSIRSVVCSERNSESNIWMTESWAFDFMVAVLERSSQRFLCWAFFVTSNILLTDLNCIRSLGDHEIQLNRNYVGLPGIEWIDRNTTANIAKIILNNSDSILERNVSIPRFGEEIQTLRNVYVIYSYEYNKDYSSKYYLYQYKFNHRVFSSFCVPFSGGPIFIDTDPTLIYGIVTKEPCGDQCNIEDNGYKVSYVRLYDYIEWIYDEPTVTTVTPKTTSIHTSTQMTTNSVTTTPITSTTILTTTSTRFLTTPTIPKLPTLPTLPNLPTLPTLPTLPSLPTLPPLPTLPTLPTLPKLPKLPTLPPLPTLPTLPNLPTLPTLPTFPSIPKVPSFTTTTVSDQLWNYINGDFIGDVFCNITECIEIKMFSTLAFEINHFDALYYISAQVDEEIQGFESKIQNKNVTSLPINVSSIFPNLVTYTFSNIGVKEITLDNFRDLRALEAIVLSDNEIEIIQSDTFNHTLNLRNLNLVGNKIEKFYESILAPIRNLEVLSLGSNFLKDNLAIFRYCSILKEISLFKNQISEIRDNIFVNCEFLETIDLNTNEISFINTEIFRNKENLMHVDLRWNMCIDKEFIGSNGTFTTDEFNSMMNEIIICDGFYTTTSVPTSTTTPNATGTTDTTDTTTTTMPITPP